MSAPLHESVYVLEGDLPLHFQRQIAAQPPLAVAAELAAYDVRVPLPQLLLKLLLEVDRVLSGEAEAVYRERIRADREAVHRYLEHRHQHRHRYADEVHPRAEGEADLVLLDELDDVVVMAEVKTRRVALDCATRVFPEEAVDAQKQRRYRRIASCYLMEHYPLKAIRFDAVGVTIRGGHIAEIEHQYNAFDWQVS